MLFCCPKRGDGVRRRTWTSYVMGTGPTNKRRQSSQSSRKWVRTDAFQLDFFAEIDDNGSNKTGAPVLLAPTLPNQNGGLSSAMISLNPTAPTTYPQHWPSYNLAQQNEKERFLVLLRDLCSTVPQPPQPTGRPRLPLADMLFASVFKVYSGFSSRRFTSDVQGAKRNGLIDHAPHFNTVSNYLANPELTPLLTSLIQEAAAPLSVVEDDFAADSNGAVRHCKTRSTARVQFWLPGPIRRLSGTPPRT